MPLPDKVAIRQSQVVVDMVREVSTGVSQGHPADATLAAIYRRNQQFGARDRRLFSDTVFSFFRWKGWLAPLMTHDPRAMVALANLLDAVECHPAIRRLAEAAGIPPDAIQPMGALTPAEKVRALHGQLTSLLPDQPAPRPEQVVPDWFQEVIDVPDGVNRDAYVERLLNAFQQTPPTWLRLRAPSVAGALAALKAEGITATPHERMERAAAVARGANLQGLAPRFRGLFEIQDLASQATGLVCAPHPGESWWDACAGSGGKTLHLADLLNHAGHILATDTRPHIVEALHRRAINDRVSSIIRTLVWNGARQPPPAGEFHGVLVDAPCSGLGTWHRNPDARWRTSRDQIAAMPALQLALLRAGAERVRPGGRIVYSTCTLTLAENAGVVERFLTGNRQFALAPFENPLTGAPTNGTLTIQPWEGPCNGMFIARFVRHC